MPRLNQRQRKKMYRSWLYWVNDASQSSYWRRKLFPSEDNEVFQINATHSVGLPEHTVRAMRRYRLQYSIKVAHPDEAEAWLSEGGAILFVLWANEFPTVRMYSGNSPAIT